MMSGQSKLRTVKLTLHPKKFLKLAQVQSFLGKFSRFLMHCNSVLKQRYIKGFDNFRYIILQSIRFCMYPGRTHFEPLRDQILSELKLGRQASGYKTAQKALNRLITGLKLLVENRF